MGEQVSSLVAAGWGLDMAEVQMGVTGWSGGPEPQRGGVPWHPEAGRPWKVEKMLKGLEKMEC